MKKCPSCAEEIQDEASKCRHCGSMLQPGHQASGVGTAAATSDPAEIEVRRLADSGHRIEAIKLFREQTGLGLKQAKDHVDAIASHLGAMPPHAPAVNSARGGVAVLISAWLLLATVAWFFGWFARW